MLVEADYFSKCAYLLETYKNQMMKHSERWNSKNVLQERRENHKTAILKS